MIYRLLGIVVMIFIIVLIQMSVLHSKAEAGKLQLIAVQMSLDIADYFSEQDFREKMEVLMHKMEEKIEPAVPKLVVFPEDVGLMLIAQGEGSYLSGAETIAEAIKNMTKKHLLSLGWLRLRYGVSWVPALYYYKRELIAETYFSTFSQLAEEHNSYIVAGSVLLPHYEIINGRVLYREKPDGPEIYNTSYIFNPEGQVIGYQDKVNLLEIEQGEALNLTSGDIEDIQVLDTDIGKLGVAVCLDAFTGKVVERLKEQGAEILIQPSANPGPWTEEQQQEWLESSYRYTHQLGYFKYAVNPMMNGRLFDLNFAGQSAIISKRAIKVTGYSNTGLLSGFEEVGNNGEEQILVVEVDI